MSTTLIPQARPPVVLECPRGSAYDEPVFHYFLAVERARAQRRRRALQLLLLTLEPDGRPVAIDPHAGGRLVAGLKHTLRDTDVMGWYRQDLVLGAVLSQRADASHPPAWKGLLRRIDLLLRDRLPSSVCATVRVRVTELGPRGVSDFASV